jgi:hypothetical protein
MDAISAAAKTKLMNFFTVLFLLVDYANQTA